MDERERAGVELQLRSWVVHFTDLHEVVKYARALESHFNSIDQPTYGSERCRLLAVSGLAVMCYRSFTCEDFIPLNVTDKRFRFPDDQPMWKALHDEVKYHRMGSGVYIDTESGMIVRVRNKGNGTQDVVIRRPGQTSGTPVSAHNRPDSEIDGKIESGQWRPAGE